MKTKVSETKKTKKRPKIDIILPKEEVINVEQFMQLRASEIKMMDLAVQQSDQLKVRLPVQKLPHHLRRRANSYNEKRQKKFPNKIRNYFNRKGNENAKWLPTHVWHAKRMHMNNLFGFKIALKPTLKCHKAIIKASKHGCCINDRSYCSVFTIHSKIVEFQSKHLLPCHVNPLVQFLINQNHQLIGEISCIAADEQLVLIVHPEMIHELELLLVDYTYFKRSDFGIFDLYGPLATLYCRSIFKPTTNTNFNELTSFPSCLNNHFFNFFNALQPTTTKLPNELFDNYHLTASDSALNINQTTIINTSWHQMNRFTILCPSKDIKLLWRHFIFCGVYACGLENVHTIYFEHQLPCYPFDYVNTDGYSKIHKILSDNELDIWNKKAPIHKHTAKPEYHEINGTICTALNDMKKVTGSLYWCFIKLYKGIGKYHDKIYLNGICIGFITTSDFNQSIGSTCCIGVVNKYIKQEDEVHIGNLDTFSVGSMELIN